MEIRKRIFRCSTSLVLIGLFFVSVIGCKPPNPQGRLAVSGNVKVNGEPVKDGTITFTPKNANAVKTPSSGVIKNGVYSLAADKGLAPGEYTVLFFASEGTGKFDETNPMRPEILKALIPDKYNVASQEKVTVDSGTTTFDFDLEVKDSDFK